MLAAIIVKYLLGHTEKTRLYCPSANRHRDKEKWLRCYICTAAFPGFFFHLAAKPTLIYADKWGKLIRCASIVFFFFFFIFLLLFGDSLNALHVRTMKRLM